MQSNSINDDEMMAGKIRERIRFNFIEGETITEGRGSHRGNLLLSYEVQL
jgi:hypothetical protein